MICIAICTRERPKMLHQMLTSCAAIIQDKRSDLTFVVIENGEKKGAEAVADLFRAELDIQYVNEPNLGIVNARNASIEFLLASNADWMASFDDDEMVSPEWLCAMLDAMDQFPECNVFAGPQIRLAPETASRWFPFKSPKKLATGTPEWNVSTANVLFNRKVFSLDGLGLRFHPEFNFSGGEDTQLFYKLKDSGEQILWVCDAECIEPTIEERGTFVAQSERLVARSQNWGKINIMRFGNLRGGLLVCWFMLVTTVNVFSYAVIGIIVLVVSEDKGVAVLSKSLRSGLSAVGYFKALFLKDGRYYKVTDGS